MDWPLSLPIESIWIIAFWSDISLTQLSLEVWTELKKYLNLKALDIGNS